VNGLERVGATMAGDSVDRRAVALVLSLYGARLTGCPTVNYYREPEAYVQGQEAVVDLLDPDIVCAPLAFELIGESFGSELAFAAHEAPVLHRSALQTAEAFDGLGLPDPDSDARLLYLRDTVELLATRFGDRAIAVALPSPVDVASTIMGLDVWLPTVLFEPEVARRVMERIVPFYVDVVNGFFAAGATLVLAACALGLPSIVTRDVVTEFTRPWLTEAFAGLAGPVILHSVGAPCVAHLDLLTGLPAVVGFAIEERDDPERAREIVGPSPVLIGGLDCAHVAVMTAADVETACRRILVGRRRTHASCSATPAPTCRGRPPRRTCVRSSRPPGRPRHRHEPSWVSSQKPLDLLLRARE